MIYAIHFTDGRRHHFFTHIGFLNGVLTYSLRSKKIVSLGWSDGYNACGYTFEDIWLPLERRNDWRKIALEVIEFSTKFKK